MVRTDYETIQIICVHSFSTFLSVFVVSEGPKGENSWSEEAGEMGAS